MESNSEIQQSKRDLQRLIKEGGLPPKMQVKLRYLLNSIEGRQVDNHLVELLPEFQKMSLQMMDISTKVSLFNSIVGCLAGRQVYIYFSAEKATLKIQSSSSSSLTCYLFGDSKALKISKNKEGNSLYYQMLMEKIMVSKIYRQEKKNFSFGISYDDMKYRLRFQEEGKCARIHGALLSIIRQKRNLVTNQTQKQPPSQIKHEQQMQEEPFEVNYQEKMMQEERQYLQSLKNRVAEINLDDSERFQLFRNTDWGKILVNRKQSQVRILMYLQKCTVAGLIQSYIQFSAWNTQVQSFRVINKIRRNTYLCSLVLKRQGLTAARETYIIVSYFKQCNCLSSNQSAIPEKSKERHYLLLNSVPTSEQFKGQNNFYPFTMSQIIQFSKVEDGNSCVFINLQSKIDFNVYEYLSNSLSKSLTFLSEIGSITLLSRERDLLKDNKKELFQFNTCICDKKIPSRLIFQGEESRAQSERKQSMNSDIGQLPLKRDQGHMLECPLKEIYEVLDNHNNKELIEKRILELINKKVYEKYYIKQSFDLQTHQQPYVSSDFHLNERQNFFQLGKSWKFNSSEELIFIDQQIIKLQKGALKLIVKQITANLMAGKSIMSMSLPVQLFSDDSALEGFAKIFGFVPFFMGEAVKKTDIVEQIKYVAAAFMFIFACNPTVTKPFNPILGETYQATVGGIPIYFQQISHHPPVSSFLIKNDKFEAHGNFDIIVDLGMNSAYSKFPTILKVKVYETNTQYFIRYPDIQVGGIMFGDRNLKLVGKGFVLQKNSGIYLQHSIAKAKKGLYQYKEKVKNADLAGGIFKILPQTINRLLSLDKKKAVQGIKPEEAVKRYSLMSGKWYGDMYFDGVMIKSFKDGPFPLKLQRPNVLLPSDCTYRLDIMYRRWRDFKTSNQEKEVLQNLQRRDRKLRQKHNPQKH